MEAATAELCRHSSSVVCPFKRYFLASSRKLAMEMSCDASCILPINCTARFWWKSSLLWQTPQEIPRETPVGDSIWGPAVDQTGEETLFKTMLKTLLGTPRRLCPRPYWGPTWSPVWDHVLDPLEVGMWITWRPCLRLYWRPHGDPAGDPVGGLMETQLGTLLEASWIPSWGPCSRPYWQLYWGPHGDTVWDPVWNPAGDGDLVRSSLETLLGMLLMTSMGTSWRHHLWPFWRSH